MPILIAKGACCGLLLVAFGVLSVDAIVAWLSDGGYLWFGSAVLLGLAAVHRWRRRFARKAPESTPGDALGRPASHRTS